jgi:site-specific recombinase XerD
MNKISVFIFLGLFIVGTAAANTVEQYLQQARTKLGEGDLTTAAVFYHKVIQLDENHFQARKELASVLMQAKMQDPHSDHSEAELAILEEISRRKID